MPDVPEVPVAFRSWECADWSVASVCVCHPGAADTLLPHESGRSHAEEGAQALRTSTGGGGGELTSTQT